MPVGVVAIAAAGVGLPDLYQLARHRSAASVEDPAGHDAALPDRFAGMTCRQVGIERPDIPLAEARGPALDLLGVDGQQGAFGMAQHTAAIRRIVEAGLGLCPAGALVFGCDGVDFRRDVGLGRDALRCGIHEA
ncbi:hypothetical protein NIIDMKKI_45390 [Mycobacterium kansasii]|uniref:Uncharacterized protein n=1 Tax=Mycobacterium kansasii TaxID=1768 RepID=A0A7G1IGN6_MYCKA|nr:hypothetical protein NIIDMKKI_45390 [Mycobacterium kansasii]